MLHYSSKRVETEVQKVFGANSFIYRSYSRKVVREDFLPSILNRVKRIIILKSGIWSDFHSVYGIRNSVNLDCDDLSLKK